MEGSELELAKVPMEYQMGRRVALDGPARPSLNPGEVVGTLFLGLMQVGGQPPG